MSNRTIPPLPEPKFWEIEEQTDPDENDVVYAFVNHPDVEPYAHENEAYDTRDVVNKAIEEQHIAFKAVYDAFQNQFRQLEAEYGLLKNTLDKAVGVTRDQYNADHRHASWLNNDGYTGGDYVQYPSLPEWVREADELLTTNS